jgi:P2-related tail formation protein
MSTTLRGSNLIDSCTPSISYDSQVKAASTAFDKQMWEIIDDTGQVLFIPNIMGITDSNLIDILAWQFHVDLYDSTKPLEFRKSLVQNSIIWHRTKGTVQLVNDIINVYWPGGGYIQEWYQYYNPLPPNYPDVGWNNRYRFRVVRNNTIIPDSEVPALLDLISRYKPISRWPEGETLDSTASTGTVYVSGFMTMSVNYASAAAPIRTPGGPSK